MILLNLNGLICWTPCIPPISKELMIANFPGHLISSLTLTSLHMWSEMLSAVYDTVHCISILSHRCVQLIEEIP